VAVLGFKNLSGKPEVAGLSTAFSEMLTTELAAGGRLRTVPGENISQMKINLALPDADSYGKETLRKIRQHRSPFRSLAGRDAAFLRAEDALHTRLLVRDRRDCREDGALKLFKVVQAVHLLARKGRKTLRGASGISTCPIRMATSCRLRVRFSSLPVAA